MTDVHELQVGNLVMDQEGNWICIHAIQRYWKSVADVIPKQEYKYFVNGFELEDINAIPITPETLAKFGFTVHAKSETNPHWAHYVNKVGAWVAIALRDDQCLPRDKSYYYKGDVTLSDGGDMPHAFHYIHELQNTYYWTFREPLIIKNE